MQNYEEEATKIAEELAEKLNKEAEEREKNKNNKELLKKRCLTIFAETNDLCEQIEIISKSFNDVLSLCLFGEVCRKKFTKTAQKKFLKNGGEDEIAGMLEQEELCKSARLYGTEEEWNELCEAVIYITKGMKKLDNNLNKIIKTNGKKGVKETVDTLLKVMEALE